jgi:beta-aspartyl-dipeptidase (metallo-type)
MGKVTKIGEIEQSALDSLGFQTETLDATDAFVVPGFIDPHEHLVGGDGEGGFSARTPVIQLPEIICHGITTVVGCLGTDNVTFHTNTLLAHVRALNEEGMTAYLWAGGYTVPPSTITGTLRSDIMLIPEVLGAGEIAVSDVRSSQPQTDELAKLVSDAYNGGLLTSKCGATHFHMGPGKHHLKPIFKILEDYDLDKTKLFPTHIGRNLELMKDACELSRRGVPVNLDTVEEDLVERLKDFEENNGDLNLLSLSSDASVTSPSTLYTEFVRVYNESKWPLEKLLPLLTSNPAKTLMLSQKGSIHLEKDADFVVLERDSLKIRHVVARGKVFVKDGHFIHELKYLENSNRNMEIYGKKKIR